MLCEGCGVIIRLDQKRLPVPAAPTRWWRNPRYRQLAALWPFAVLIAIFTYAYISDRKPPTHIPVSGPIDIAAHAPTYVIAPTFLPAPAPAPVPLCARQPQNGDVIIDGRPPRGGGRDKIGIKNGSQGNAIVIMRRASTSDLVVVFFVESGHYAEVWRLPDDKYRIRWVLGDMLGDDCMTFAAPISAGEYDDLEDLATDHAVTFTLYTVPSGNARFHSIPLEQFYGK